MRTYKELAKSENIKSWVYWVGGAILVTGGMLCAHISGEHDAMKRLAKAFDEEGFDKETEEKE